MIKHQDLVAYQLLEEFAGGPFRSGVHLFSLESGAVDISYTGGFIDDHRPRIEELKAAIIAGEIDVPCIPESRADAARALGISQDSCLPPP